MGELAHIPPLSRFSPAFSNLVALLRQDSCRSVPRSGRRFTYPITLPRVNHNGHYAAGESECLTAVGSLSGAAATRLYAHDTPAQLADLGLDFVEKSVHPLIDRRYAFSH